MINYMPDTDHFLYDCMIVVFEVNLRHISDKRYKL